jgi:hypothetical protein
MTREAAIPLLLEASLEEDAGSSPQGNDIMVAYHLIHDARRMYEYKGGAPSPSSSPHNCFISSSSLLISSSFLLLSSLFFFFNSVCSRRL